MTANDGDVRMIVTFQDGAEASKKSADRSVQSAIAGALLGVVRRCWRLLRMPSTLGVLQAEFWHVFSVFFLVWVVFKYFGIASSNPTSYKTWQWIFANFLDFEEAKDLQLFRCDFC